MIYACGRGVSTHGDVLNVHTGVFSVPHHTRHTAHTHHDHNHNDTLPQPQRHQPTKQQHTQENHSNTHTTKPQQHTHSNNTEERRREEREEIKRDEGRQRWREIKMKREKMRREKREERREKREERRERREREKRAEIEESREQREERREKTSGSNSCTFCWVAMQEGADLSLPPTSALSLLALGRWDGVGVGSRAGSAPRCFFNGTYRTLGTGRLSVHRCVCVPNHGGPRGRSADCSTGARVEPFRRAHRGCAVPPKHVKIPQTSYTYRAAVSPVRMQRQTLLPATKHVEIPQTQYIDKDAVMPVVMQRQVPWPSPNQTTKHVEIPQKQYIDKVVMMVVVMQRQVPRPSRNRTFMHVEISQTQYTDKVVVASSAIQRQVPQLQTVATTVEVPVVSILFLWTESSLRILRDDLRTDSRTRISCGPDHSSLSPRVLSKYCLSRECWRGHREWIEIKRRGLLVVELRSKRALNLSCPKVDREFDEVHEV